MKTRLTERDLTRIVRRVIKEQEEDVYSDLYGKTVTFKDEKTGITLKGKIKRMVEVRGYDDISISFDNLYMIRGNNYDEVYSLSDQPNVMYGCGENVFYINLYDLELEEQKRIKTFTCKTLSDVLNDRLPCKTDFVMNNTNVKSNFA
jgi:hypothetical protein